MLEKSNQIKCLKIKKNIFQFFSYYFYRTFTSTILAIILFYSIISKFINLIISSIQNDNYYILIILNNYYLFLKSNKQ